VDQNKHPADKKYFLRRVDEMHDLLHKCETWHKKIHSQTDNRFYDKANSMQQARQEISTRKQRKRQQRKVGREEEGSSSNRPELAAFVLALRGTL